MELWIRSQDKRILQKVDNVYLNANYDNRRICTNDSRDYESDLGEYKTKERALEILDEIQNIIRGKYAVSLDMKAAFSKDISQKEAEQMLMQMAVYEMPKE